MVAFFIFRLQVWGFQPKYNFVNARLVLAHIAPTSKTW